VPPTAEKSIFLAAVEIASTSARQAYLDEVCKQDADLRAKVEALLRASEEPRQLLDAPDSVRTILGQAAEMEGPGTIIGSYKLLEQIGEGGMGLVFVAEQTQPVHRRVALKVIKPGMDSRQVIARFEAERQALALMDHPHIAHVFDGGTTQSGRPYFVMELVRGLPITQFCDDNRLALSERLGLFHAVCQAVQHAHHKGIIHRDIKPSNVMVTSHDGTPVVKIIDFGIAKATGQRLTDKTVYTQFAQFVGTPTYLSPEQAGLSGIDVDTRTDIYALGVLLYELLTGSTPFSQERLQQAAFDEMRRIIREEEPPRPSTRISTVGQAASTISAKRQSDPKRLRQAYYGELDWIAMKALEKERRRRYETASAFAADVQRFLDHEPVQAHPPSLNYRLRKFVRRHRAGVLAASLVGLALLAGIVGMTWGLFHATQAEALALQEAKQKEAALGAARQSQQEATDKLWLSLFERARAGRFSRLIGQRLASLAALEQAARIRPDERLRVEAIAAMALPDLRPLPGKYVAPPDATAQASGIKRQLFVRAHNAPAGHVQRISPRADNLAALEQAPQVRPDEHLRDEAIAAMALPDRPPLPGRYVAPPGTNALAFGYKGQLYARATNRGVLCIHNISDNREVRRIASGQIVGMYLHFSGDDRYLLGVVDDNNTLGLWRVADGQPVLRDKYRQCWAYAFSPDGKRLAVGEKKSVVCFDLATGREVKRFELPEPAHTLAFHPDSVQLAVGLTRKVRIYDAAKGALLIQLPVGAMDNLIVAWHPDGQRLAVAGSDPRIQIWNVPAKRIVALLEGHVQRVPDLAFHPSGDLLASHGWDGRLILWQPSSGRQLLGFTTLGAPQFSAEGRWLRLTWDGNQSDLLEVAAAREYRTLVSSAGVNRGVYDFGDISPDGRLLAVGLDDGARLWDLASGRELVNLPAGTPYVFFDTGNRKSEAGAVSPPSLPWGLLTSGSGGLRRWPLLTDGLEGTGLRLGAPKQLSRLGRARFGRTPDGRTLVAATQEGGTNQLLDLATGKVRELGSHPDGEIRALSGDGRFAASCGWHSDRVRLLDAVTGRLIREWVLGKRNLVFFTPDSRGLVICSGDEFSFWDVETLRPLRRVIREQNQFPGWVAFSPDARLMALEMAPGVIHLMDVASGRTVARLTDPDGDRAWWQAFTPDGTRLVTVARIASAVHIWDLRAIRARLKAMNLDWDWPEYPVPPTAEAR